jgi:hypothetical protein
MPTANDFTPGGTKIEGQYENDRNAENSELYKAMIRECFGVSDVIIAHHLVYVTSEKRDGFEYQIVEEIPSADTLIFDHDIAKKIWGDGFRDVLVKLALEPPETRDRLCAELYYGRRV